MERLPKARELRATAFRLENDLSNLRSGLGALEDEAKPLGPSGAEFAKTLNDIIGKLDDIAGTISGAGRALEGRERYAEDDEGPSATALVVAEDVDLEPPDAQGVAAMLEALEYAAEDGRWHGRMAAEAAAWLVRQHPALRDELRALADQAAAPGGSESLLFQAQMKP